MGITVTRREPIAGLVINPWGTEGAVEPEGCHRYVPALPCPMPESADPSLVRVSFVNLLEQGRRKLALTAGDGSIRNMAREMKVAPSRAADWTRNSYNLTITEGGTVFGGARLRKAVSGFVSSVERALDWLRTNGFAEEVKTLVSAEGILAGYWPPDQRELLTTDPVINGVKDGMSAVEPQFPVQEMRIEVRIVPWEIFTHWDGSPGEAPQASNTGFFWSYADAVLKSVDPLDSIIDLEKSTFAQALDLPVGGRADVKILSLGLYDTLHREFRGVEFVGIPLFRVPLVGLEIRRENGGLAERLDFETAFGRNPVAPFAVEHEVGHLFLRSIARDKDSITRIPDYKDPRDVAERLHEAVMEGAPGAPVTFLGDGTIALGVYARLRNIRGISVEVIKQEFPHELSYSIGFMVREEDQGFLRLLRAAQAGILTTPWRVTGLLERLLEGLESWTDNFLIRDALLDWGETPIFLFDPEDLRRAGLAPAPAKRLARKIRGWIAEKRESSPSLKQLWQDVDWENAP
jgi:hypothetical protein